jgi:shikimate kinase
MNRRIVLLGFMACGKTTVAKELARQLECKFADLDSFIIECHSRSPAEIIQHDGEEKFREIETLALRDVLQSNDARVIALGGGTWTIPANRTLIALHDCVSIWLDAPFELCWQRINASPTERPLAPDHDAALARYEARRADYSLAKQITVTEASTPATLAEEILRES